MNKMNSIKLGAFLTLVAGFLASLILFLGFYKATPPADNILGAISGPGTTENFFSVGGRKYYSVAKRLITSTTTPCAIEAPRTATSTLIAGGINFDVSSTTASLVTISKSTTAYATTSSTNINTTILATSTYAANALGFSDVTASSTVPISNSIQNIATAFQLYRNNLTFGPSAFGVSTTTYMVIGMQDTTAENTAGTFSPSGTCSATWLLDSEVTQ